MCGRVVFTGVTEGVIHDFRVGRLSADLPVASWNIAPSQDIAVMLQGKEDAEPRIESARWGLVPPWAESMKLPYPTFNARAETAAQKPTFRAGVHSRRCAIVVDGYYEWLTQDGTKTPFYVHQPESSLVFAGLYGWWHDPAATRESGWNLTATMLTTAAAEPLAWLHPRMPVPLAQDLAEPWLARDLVGDEALLQLVTKAGAQLTDSLLAHEVAPLRGNGEELIRPLP